MSLFTSTAFYYSEQIAGGVVPGPPAFYTTSFATNMMTPFFAINLASCSYFKKTNQPAKTRIVSLDGQYREIVTKTPEMNAKILASQVNLSEEKKKFAEMMKGAENK